MDLVAMSSLLVDSRGIGTQILNTTGHKVAAVYHAKKSGNIRTIRGLCTAAVVTGGNPTFDVRVETVNTADGNPSGTLFGTNTNATLTVSASGAWEVTLTADAAVSEGDSFAVVVNCTSGSATSSATFTVQGTTITAAFPYSLTNTGSWSKQASPPCGQAPFYDDGEMVAGATVFSSSTTTESWGSSSTPDEIGNVWQFADSVDIGGVHGQFSAQASGSFDVVIYDDAGTALYTRTFDSDMQRSANNEGSWDLKFPPITIAAATNFRIVLKPTTNNARLAVRSFVSSAIRAQHSAEAQYTSRTDGGSFSDDATKLALICPVIEAFNGGGGGGTVVANVAGVSQSGIGVF